MYIINIIKNILFVIILFLPGLDKLIVMFIKARVLKFNPILQSPLQKHLHHDNYVLSSGH